MNAAERAYVFTKRRILDGRFPGGELLSEGDVASGVGVSRTPVREAFLRLESEGLLRLYPKRGALVVPVSTAEVESVLETRLVVERFAVEKAIRLGVDLNDRLEAAIARQETLTAPEQSRRFVEADRQFHRLLVEAAGNDILINLHDSLRDRQSRMGLAAIARSAERIVQILDEHRALAAAIAARDVEQAQAIVDQHLYAALAVLKGSGHTIGA